MSKTMQMLLAAALMLAGTGVQAEMALIQGVRAANRGACENNLKAIGDLIGVYVTLEGGQLPAADNAAGLKEFGGGYSQCATRHFKSDKETKDPVERDNSYIYFGGFNLEQLPNPAVVPLVFDKPGNNHVNVLYADMHVESYKVSDMKSCLQIIEELNKQKKFPDDLLAKLREKAKKVDEALGYDNKDVKQ